MGLTYDDVGHIMPSYASRQSELLTEQTADAVALWAHCTHQIFRCRADAFMVVMVDVEGHMARFGFSQHGCFIPTSWHKALGFFPNIGSGLGPW